MANQEIGAVIQALKDDQNDDESYLFNEIKSRCSAAFRTMKRALPTMSKINLLKFSIYILCFSTFLYQSYKVTNKYLKYETNPKLSMSFVSQYDVPSITVCYEGFITNRDLINQFTKYGNINDGSNLKVNLTTQLIINLTPDKLWNLWSELFTDCKFNSAQDGVIRCDYDQGIKPLKSVIDGLKCVTFLSKFINDSLNDTYLTMDQDQGYLVSLGFPDPLGRSSLENSVKVVLESNNKIETSLLNSKLFKIGHAYEIEFTRTQVNQLESPYETHCKKYHKQNTFDKSYYGISQSDCIYRCLTTHLRINFSCLCSRILFEHQFFPTDKICDRDYWGDDWGLSKFKSVQKLCELQCPVDCKQTFYEYSDNLKGPFNDTSILLKIKPKSVPMMTITHEPAMDLMTYICNIGGLLGLWLGLSIYTLIITTVKSLASFFTNNKNKQNLILPFVNHRHLHQL